ncbi:hypothetical protein B9130_26725 (plasmid) [Shigella sonnei]|nr:hypothetical protein B9130_26725 [Shigella sonnei]
MGAAHPAPSRGKREGRTRGAGAGNAQESPAVRGAGLARGQRRARCLSHARRLDCDGHPAWFVHARLGRAAGLGGLRGELRDRARRPACRPHFRRRGCGMLIRTPTQARQKVADDVDRVRREFVVNDKRLHRWQRWLDDDSSWPDFSVVVHGDLYVGHVLIDNTERVSGMIDWSEARVDDPAIDMAAHLMVFGEEGLAKLLLTYEAAGGRVWPRLAHHIAERLAFGAVTYALFALDSGNEEYLAAAKAQLAAAEAAE